MLKKIFPIVAAGLIFTLAGPVLAGGLDCSVNAGPEDGNWITTQYQFAYAPGDATATAIDGVIQAFLGGPTTAKVSDTAKKTVFSWTVITTSNTGQGVNMVYRAAYFKSNKTVTISATPAGYSNSFEARGTCSAF